MSFARRLLRWYDAHGRRDLPWQQPRSPYRVWLSEVMLQQTQVATVRGYFERFVAHFPSVEALAAAPLDAVLAHWQGLGYYSRARNLHRAAQRLVAEHGGQIPADPKTLATLPGVGRSTAGAIAAQAFGRRAPILDGNVRRVLARHAAVEGDPMSPAVQRRLWALAESLLPRERLADYTQALMDLGAHCCTPRSPDCAHCPVRGDCRARIEDRVATLPTPRRRRATPLREVALLIAHDPARAVLLERRADRGIWGGLWSLPEADDAASATQLARSLGARAHLRALAPIEHTFTHFRLRATPYVVRLPRARVEPTRAFVARDSLAGYGTPTPIRRLLHHFWENPA